MLISRRKVKDTEARGYGHLKALCQSALGGEQCRLLYSGPSEYKAVMLNRR